MMWDWDQNDGGGTDDEEAANEEAWEWGTEWAT